jgi:sugar lactone lactonase YvrE
MRPLTRITMVLLCIAPVSSIVFAQPGTITTYAGNGTFGFSGDGGPATSAQFVVAEDLTVDKSGNLFIADSYDNRIRKVTPGGMISTFVGSGAWGFRGDGGPASSAWLNRPVAVTADTAGNLFFSDMENQRVRKVTPGGIISTVAGNGIPGFSGDGGKAISAELNYPDGIAVDNSGNLFIADSHNSRIRKVTPGGIITTYAGSGNDALGEGISAISAQFGFPSSISIDTAGNLFIADGSRVRKVTPDGIIRTVAGSLFPGSGGDCGPATSAHFQDLQGIAIDAAGNLFIADQVDNRVRKVTPDGIISTVAGNGTYSFSGDGGQATSAQCSPSSMAVDSSGNLYFTDGFRVRKVERVSESKASMNLILNNGGTAVCSTAGLNEKFRTGYAELAVSSGVAPYSTAVFKLKQNGVVVSEAGVPVAPPTRSARIFIDYRAGVNAVPARSNAGTVDINTGIAVVNYGSEVANVSYTLRDSNGNSIAVGHGTIARGRHLACFVDQLKEIAALDFNLPTDFQSAIQFGSLEIASDQPVSVLAMRETINQRNEVLMTTTPVADLTKAPPSGNTAIYFPQLADGGGYTTTLILLNTSGSIERGRLQIFDKNGSPIAVNQVGGTRDSTFYYSIPAGGVFRLQTDGFPSEINAGWVRLMPAGTPTPVGSGVFGFNPEDVLVSESGIPSASATTHIRVYADVSTGHNTGLAIANISGSDSTVTVAAYRGDGVTPAGISEESVILPIDGYKAAFADEFINGLPEGFTGVLDISSRTPFAALTLRMLVNERNEFLMTTFPVADMTQPAPVPLLFPQLADGGGYATQVILLSPGGQASTILRFYDEMGELMDILR